MDGENKFEIILYLIIVVGGILANAYRSMVKKREEERRRAEHTEVDFPELEDEPVAIPEIDSAYEYEPLEEAEPEPEEEKILANTSESEYDEVISSFAQSEDESFPAAEELMIESMDDDRINLISSEIKDGIWEAGAREDVSDDFDLRKAIIYSEIINSKYI